MVDHYIRVTFKVFIIKKAQTREFFKMVGTKGRGRGLSLGEEMYVNSRYKQKQIKQIPQIYNY